MFETTLDRRALTEVYNIISALEKSDFDKIPRNIIDAIRCNMDLKYDFSLVKIMNNELLEDTERILSILYTDYLATYDECDVIYKMENLKYTYNNVEYLDNKKSTIDEVKSLIIFENDNENKNIFQKIINKIRKFFSKKEIK